MMTFIRKLVWVVCWALLLTNFSTTNAQNNLLDPTQTYVTGNLVNSGTSPTNTTGTWQNIGLWNQGLPCWAPGGPVYCGPQPYYNSGSFNFSYGLTDVYQTANIAAALPYTGTGLLVKGYNFSFIAKNGNGWDDGRVDTLNAYVTFYDKNNSVAYNKNYNLNYKFDWSGFNFDETFKTPYAAADLSLVRYGFVGRDNNFWAGPYGPEIYNVSFSLKYTVDPCYVDVLSSPNCPGYLDALNRLSTSSTPEPVASTTTSVTSTSTAIAPTSSTSTTAPTTDSVQPIATSTVSASTTSPTTSATSTATTSVTPTANNPQPRVGEVQISGSPPANSKSSVSTSQILSIVRNEQTRIGNLETATAAAAVEQAKQEGAKTTEAAQAIAATQQASVMANAAQVISSTMSSNAGASGSTAGAVTQNAGQGLMPMSLPGSLSITQFRGPEIYSLVTSPVNNEILSNTINRQNLIETTNINQDITNDRNTLTSPTNQLAAIMNPPLVIPAAPVASTGPTVNREVRDNDAAAGGISMATLARQPAGFELYMTALTDRPFYPPREVYPGQRVIDNARILRGLQGGSDRVHQQMIEQQYQRGN